MIKNRLLAGFLLLLLPLGACSLSPDATAPSTQTATARPLAVGAIPDQDPEKLQRLYGQLTSYLEQELGVPVVYQPVTDYSAAVSAFRVGDLDLVWFGGLTGVQARSQVPGAEAIAQRDIDAQFHSVFIANQRSGIEPIQSLKGLSDLQGHTFTFGSESSTSGRLMPQYFLQEAGVKLSDFKGDVGFSSSHDATLQLVEAGSFEAGALNEQVWQSRVQAGEVDQDKVQVIWQSPAYYDYHWVIHPTVEERYGPDFSQRVQAALLNLNPNNPNHKEILELFGADRFIATQNSNYDQIEAIAREIGKLK